MQIFYVHLCRHSKRQPENDFPLNTYVTNVTLHNNIMNIHSEWQIRKFQLVHVWMCAIAKTSESISVDFLPMEYLRMEWMNESGSKDNNNRTTYCNI